MMALVLATLLDVVPVSGELPQPIDAAAVTRISWVAGDMAAEPRGSECQLLPPRGWVCHVESLDAVGVVLVETAKSVGFVVRGPAGLSATGVGPWGGMIRVDPLGLDVEVTAAA